MVNNCVFCHYCCFKYWVQKRIQKYKLHCHAVTFQSHWYIKLIRMHSSVRLLLRNFCNFYAFIANWWINIQATTAQRKEICSSLWNIIVIFFNNRCKFRLQLLNNNQLFGITSFQKGNRVSVGYICICTMNFLKSV